jgi:hypothetical protein
VDLLSEDSVVLTLECPSRRGKPIIVLAESLRRAEEVLRFKYPKGEVRLVFPLDGEHIFAGHGEGEEIEGQDLL